MTLDLNSLSNKQLQLLNILSLKIKVDYNSLIEDIYSKSNKQFGWIVNSLLSRNPYVSDLFINILYLQFIRLILEKNNKITRVVLINNSIYKTLLRYLNENEFDVEVILNKPKKKTFFKKEKSFIRNIYCSLLLFLNKKSFEVNKEIVNKKIRLIDIFWDKEMFVNNGFKDKYYGRLLDFFTKKEKESIYYLPHIVEVDKLSFFRSKSKIKGINVIFKHDYLKISDYFFALTMPFRLKFDENISFKGINIQDLLIKDFKDNLFNSSSFYGLLNYRFVMRLKNYFPTNIELFINWFENQLIDRGLNKGFNDYFINLDTKGYQGFIVSLDYNTFLCPTKLEMSLGVLPSEIYACGRGLKNSLKRFNENLIVNSAPAFRFEHLWNNKSNLRTDSELENSVLVILPFIYSESVKIINKIHEIINDKRLKNLKYLLKLHPDLNKDELLSLIDPLPKNIKFEDRGIQDSLKDSILIIGNTSTACNEAIALGIPAIILGDSIGLTQNPIPLMTDKILWKLVFGKKELLSAIIYFISINKSDKEKFINSSLHIKLNYFEPLSHNSAREFLNFNAN